MLVLFGTPTAIGVLVGLVYSIRLRGELDEARRLAAVMCRELDDAGYELQRMRETLDRAADEPPTVELPVLRPVPCDAGGRHRLVTWEEAGTAAAHLPRVGYRHFRDDSEAVLDNEGLLGDER